MRIVCSFYRITAGRSTVFNRIMVALRVLVVYLRTRREQRDTGIYLRNIQRILYYIVHYMATSRGLNKKNKNKK